MYHVQGALGVMLHTSILLHFSESQGLAVKSNNFEPLR